MGSDGESRESQQTLAGVDRLIHEPSRLSIMAHLFVVDSADFLFLVRQTGMTWGNLSVHVSRLEAAGYVDVKKEFLGKKPHTVASLTKKGRGAFEAYRAGMKRVLEGMGGSSRQLTGSTPAPSPPPPVSAECTPAASRSQM